MRSVVPVDFYKDGEYWFTENIDWSVKPDLGSGYRPQLTHFGIPNTEELKTMKLYVQEVIYNLFTKHLTPLTPTPHVHTYTNGMAELVLYVNV